MTVTLDQVIQLLPALSEADKHELIRHVVHSLNTDFPGIEADPAVCGGDPRIIRTRIPVWILEQSRRLGISDAQLLDDYPSLRAQDLANAWAFVTAHPREIESQITENEAA